jgi:putative transposase
MPRQPRSYLDDGVYHVTGRATGGERLFLVDIDRVDFTDLFRSTAYGFNWLCRAYCLMGTHYHLILEASREALSAGMQRLNGVYAQRFNYRHDRRGRLFARRFAAYVVRDDRHLEAACRYVLENPVRAGLCERAEELALERLGSAAVISPALRGPGPTTRGERSLRRARSGSGTRERARLASACGSASYPRR